MSKIRVGIVGAGWIAREHLRVLDSGPEAELVAVCDVDTERAQTLAAGTGARTYPNWRDLLDREDLGALFVCTPPGSHREPAIAALSHGLPVYLEKPIARTIQDAAEIVAAAARSGTVCAVGYQWHALDLLDDLPELLAGQQIGLLIGTSVGPTQSRPWFVDMRSGGGNLLERGSHHLDLARAVAGEVVTVQAGASRIRLARDAADAGDIDDALTMMLEFSSGALATVVVAWTRPGQPGTYGLDILASEATLKLALDPDFTLSGVSQGQEVSRRAGSHPFERSVRRFLRAVAEQDPAAVACTPPDAAATLAVAVAAEQALATSRAVEVGTVQRADGRSMKSPRIAHISWGSMEVEGLPPGKDFKLYPGGGRPWDWSEHGTRHEPGIQPADVQELIDHHCTVVVLSRGMELRLQIMPGTLQLLQEAGIVVHSAETTQAVETYNRLAETEAVAGLFHSTC